MNVRLWWSQPLSVLSNVLTSLSHTEVPEVACILWIKVHFFVCLFPWKLRRLWLWSKKNPSEQTFCFKALTGIHLRCEIHKIFRRISTLTRLHYKYEKEAANIRIRLYMRRIPPNMFSIKRSESSYLRVFVAFFNPSGQVYNLSLLIRLPLNNIWCINIISD